MKYSLKIEVKSVSHFWLFATPWTVADQVPPSMGFSRKEYWSVFPFPSPGESSQPRDQTLVSCIVGWYFTVWATSVLQSQECSLGISYFLEAISSLSHFIVFLYFLYWSLRKAFLSLLAILWNSAFKWVYLPFWPLCLASLLFSAICKASSDNHFAFLHFFFLGMVLISTSCTMSWTSVHSSLEARSPKSWF